MSLTQPQLNLSSIPCDKLKGVGKKLSEKLANLNIFTIQDLLFHLPARYQDRTRVNPIKTSNINEHAVIEGVVITASIPKGGRTKLLVRVADESGHLHIRFFYTNPVQFKTLKDGVRLRIYGEVRLGPLGLEMIHPEYKIIVNEGDIPNEQFLTPIYPTTEGLSQLMWRKLTLEALKVLDEDIAPRDIIPEEILNQFNFPSLKQALQFVHRPTKNAVIQDLLDKKHITQQRLIFEELLAHRLSLLNLKKHFQVHKGLKLEDKNTFAAKFKNSLPFKLTQAQQKVLQEIYDDIEKPNPMLRLIQGDVGSGKTVVAAFSALRAVENNHQTAILAPTEILAEQHFKSFSTWFVPLGINVIFLSGQVTAAERRAALEKIQNGEAHIVIGTHAIFQKTVIFKELALIIVDEQHRFGVKQRAELREKGVNGEVYPHQLMMTATPIPRTLAMTVYADMDLSIIDELPPGRKPVLTGAIPNTKRDEILQRIDNACKNGRQAYWVCTLIEESEVMQCQAAENQYEHLKSALPNLNIGLIHGRMKSNAKEEVMQDFKSGKIDLLVATTVIEVGVDVSNASLMIIENPERLGLAQLHQLRGRVGRGTDDSYCLLLYQSPLSIEAKKRLAVMRETSDGFKIAKHDLEIRGPGEVLGTKQTGDINFKIADLLRDGDLTDLVIKAADVITKNYSDTTPKIISRWLGIGEKYSNV